MQLIDTNVRDVKIIAPKRHGDDRGWFSETFRDDWFRAHVADVTFVQDNHSKSAELGTLRGLHFQTPPHGQAKLVRCVTGSIWDVAVDIRKGSPDYGKWAAAELSAENGRQLYIPVGFAHGFVTLTADTEVAYKVTDYYAPECDGGIAWNDSGIDLPWPLPDSGPILSGKDEEHPGLAGFDNPFIF
ncbi:dTDP-4-dehydrorhamnose 3,5-epimerase [Sphingorhabdus sp. Alg239-R122]|uniref:dTDP-4-dehydrorhamnose 3,5-epimerase n=1 Tax=Sphingorhabdus sp. Alg239-R122 TaxID=2305989 RepID=UPI0013DB161F|nr:dTDP-4-dehydrorhamnose 3,5-epimerase [Sphingorhabdus sp. Alg239-R122]